MRFFFVEEAPAELEGTWSPPAELWRHLKALRLEPQDPFLLLLPMGGAVLAQIEGSGRLRLSGLTEMPQLKLLPVTLATAWPKGSRADRLIHRATEAGVERIVPLHCDRSVAGTREFSASRIARWRRLAQEACQQCGRPMAPSIESRPVPLESILEEAPVAHPVALVPGSWPLAMELTLHTPREVLLLVGPEGGFSEAELGWLDEQGVHKAGLLPTVLRVESAGAVAGAICQHWYSQLLSR